MLHRAVALVGLLALSPAHATLIEHSPLGNAQDYGVGIGDTVAGEFLFGDAPRANYPNLWRLQTLTRGDERKADGPLVRWVEYCLGDRFAAPLTSSGLQVLDASDGGAGALNRWLGASSTDGPRVDTRTSVTEPTTLSLLGAGVLGALAVRRRKRDADA